MAHKIVHTGIITGGFMAALTPSEVLTDAGLIVNGAMVQPSQPAELFAEDWSAEDAALARRHGWTPIRQYRTCDHEDGGCYGRGQCEAAYTVRKTVA